ncbi:MULTISPECIES: hypothetical protein [Actinosynnema]|uniref:hypothetical protein n=1 Tax=Actinosynnema TaxID=40566 RepID=UPI0020A38913|nr:hypothetical protein [Actinosynnema pretiosum]
MGEANRWRQKCLSSVWGVPLLELLLARLCPALPDPRVPITLLTGHLGDQIDRHADRWRTGLDPRITTVAKTAPGWTGVHDLARRLPQPVIVVAGNVLLDHTTLLPGLLAAHHHDGRPVVAGSLRWRTTNHHTLTARGGTVASWHRAPDRTGHYEVVDTYLLTSPVLEIMRAHRVSHTRALHRMAEQGAVAFREFVGDWLHVETPDDLHPASARKAVLCPPSSSSPALPPPASPPSPAASPST